MVRLFAVDGLVDSGLQYLQRGQSLAQARAGGRALPIRPLLVTGAKGTGRTAVSLEIARRAELDRALMAGASFEWSGRD